MTKYRSVYRILLLSVLVACTGFRARAAATPPAYHVTDLGTLGGAYSAGFGINASGQVAGDSYTTGGATHAFLYDGTLHDLGTLVGNFSYGSGINDSGHVTGWSGTHAFLYDGTLHDLGTLGGTSSYGSGINDSGQVTGTSSTGIALHAFLYDGMLHDLGTLGGSVSVANGINASGQVTGLSQTTADAATRAFLWTPTTPGGVSGTMHDLGTLGGTDSYGWGINASGQVTGESFGRAFLWTPTMPDGSSGTMQDLGSGVGYGINASGQVTGYTWTGNAAQHAFLYTSGNGMVDLNSLIDPLSGWELIEGRAINDAGQITGHGLIGGEQHAFLLNPVPEPASLALLALGLPFLVWRNSRRSGSGGVRRGRRFVLAATRRALAGARLDQ